MSNIISRKFREKNPNYHKEWRMKNKERLKRYKKEYRLKNKERLLEQESIWRDKNRDLINNQQKNWRKTKKYKEWRILFNEIRREIYLKNSIKIKNEVYSWREKNKFKVNEINKSYNKEKRKTNKNFNVLCKLRCRLNNALKTYTLHGKYKKADEYGINYQTIIEHLKPFPEDLSKYHIDHIKPLCSFDLTNLEQIKEAFAPENHQWLTIQENLSKGGR